MANGPQSSSSTSTRTMVGDQHMDGVLIKSVTDAARILTDTYAFGRIGTSVYDGTDTAHTWISSTSPTTARCRKRRSTRWWRPSGCPGRVCLRRQVHRRRHRAPVGWSITSGGHHLAIALNMFIPLADRAGMNHSMSFETVPYFDINAGAPIRLTKLEMGFHLEARPTPQH
jgi:hypothetical protein